MFNKVLIVDDDPAMLRILTVQLKLGGYEVFAANTSRRALELVKLEQPEYLITDWDMPEMDGLELCRRARQLDLPHYLYVVFLSGRSGDENLVAAIDAGADDFLSKPLRQPELLARLTAGARVLQLESRLSKLAAQDALSGLLLRRPFNGFLDKEWHRSRRFQLPLSVVMLDIDHFKQVNDTHGHPAGDEVIRTVSRLIQQQARECDVVCRYGGEEFCVLLPETNEVSATVWAEQLRSKIAGTTIAIGNTTTQVTVSLGVAEMLVDLEDKDQLLALADQCLITAKRNGRNLVVSDRGAFKDDASDDLGTIGCSSRNVLAREAMIPTTHSLRPDWTLVRGASHLLRHLVSSVPVINKQGDLLGIVSEKDVLNIAHQSDATNQCVADVMRCDVITYEETASLSQILSFLSRSSLRSVVITSDGKPSGLITRASLIRWFLSNSWSSSVSKRQWSDSAASLSDAIASGTRPS